MRKKLSLAMLFMFSWLILGTQIISASQNPSFSFQNILPRISNSSDDLDARDSMNRPVASPAARTELQEIFQSGLFTLLTAAELPSMAKALSSIRQMLSLAKTVLSRHIPLVRTIVSSLGFSFRRQWEKMLMAFAGLGVMMACLRRYAVAVCLPVHPAVRIPVVLRC